jgi:hypothetical protein
VLMLKQIHPQDNVLGIMNKRKSPDCSDSSLNNWNSLLRLALNNKI